MNFSSYNLLLRIRTCLISFSSHLSSLLPGCYLLPRKKLPKYRLLIGLKSILLNFKRPTRKSRGEPLLELPIFNVSWWNITFVSIRLPFAKGASFNGVALTSLTGSLDTPVALVPVSKSKVVVKMVSNDAKENSLVLTFDNAGKLANSNTIKGANANTVYHVTGCKATDELILVEQACDEAAKSGCRKFAKQVWLLCPALAISGK